MGGRILRGAIRLVTGNDPKGTTTGQDWALEWEAPPAGRSAESTTRRDGFPAYIAENILPHEAGHRAFSSYTIFFTGPQGYAGYGSLVPDWFDESPAVWMESAVMRTNRVKSVIGTKPSLRRLVTMDHPGTEAVVANTHNPGRKWRSRTIVPPCPACSFLPESLRSKYRVTDIGIDALGRPDTNNWYSEVNPQKQETLEDREFYPLSYMLLRFIHTRGGPVAVRELISRYREDPRPRANVLVELPGLPATFAAFERDWLAFLANPPAEDQ